MRCSWFCWLQKLVLLVSKAADVSCKCCQSNRMDGLANEPICSAYVELAEACSNIHLSPNSHDPVSCQFLHGPRPASLQKSHLLSFGFIQKKKYLPTARELLPPLCDLLTFFSLAFIPHLHKGTGRRCMA